MSNATTSGGLGRLGQAVLDGTGLSGAAMITYGAHLIYHPAGFIIGGLFLLAGAWITARKAP